MTSTEWGRGELVSAVRATAAAPVHATEIGRAPHALCGALVDRVHTDPLIGSAFDLRLFAPYTCLPCVAALMSELRR